MDFGILLQAIGSVGILMLLIGLLLGLLIGWITVDSNGRWSLESTSRSFVVEMIQNRVLQGIIILLPVVVVLIILFYHMIASS